MSPELADLSLLELFAMELQTHHQSIEEGLMGLESPESGADPQRLEALMRAAHSIKGAARIVNLTQAVGLAHAMEDMFQAAQKGQLALTPARVDSLLAANDFFGRVAASTPSSLPDVLADAAGEAARLEQAVRDAQADTGQMSSPSEPSAQKAAESTVQASTPSQTHADPAPKPEAAVRLSADLLDRLMGLAGQCAVEAGTMGRIFSQARAGGRDFMDLVDLMAELRAGLDDPEADPRAKVESAMGLIADMTQTFDHVIRSMDGLARRLEILSDKLSSQVLGSRMRHFGEGARPLPRLTRDLARELGKKALFSLDGSRTLVDRDILERLEAPLMHLVRNALDHGLEPPEVRLGLGKPAQGRITLAARHVSGHLEVRLSDDGQGIDLDALRTSVVRKGLAGADMAARLSRTELLDFLFLPGFTTAASLTQVSGRGVGLDVVKTMVQEVGGSIRVETESGAGTTFVLRLPVSRSVIRALVMQAAGEAYALPLSRIGRVVLAEPQDIASIEGRQFLTLDGANIGLAPASQILGRPDSPPSAPELPVVILESDDARFGLAVDAFLGERDLVVLPLDPRLGKVPNVAAASILDDGSPVLILDDADLARSLEALLAEGRLARVGTREQAREHGGDAQTRGPKSVLVVDDSLTVREVERQLLAGRGYRAVTAVDGMEGLALARTGEFDLILTDVDMPRMTGIELTRAVKADPALARTPVMIVSYKDRQEDRMAGLEAGADYYLPKAGFRDEALLDAVRDLIGEP
jgi:two-component system sensor histidine kinase and response regulator WspE